MKTWDEIKNAIQCLPVTMAIWRTLKKEDSTADKMLIASAVCGDPHAPYLIEGNFDTKSVQFGIDWDNETQKYYRVVCFKLVDVFRAL